MTIKKLPEKDILQDEGEIIWDIVEKKISEISELFETADNNLENILQKADKKIEELNKSLDETSQNREFLKTIKPDIAERSQEAKKTVIINFLFGNILMPESHTGTTAAEILFFSVLQQKSYEEIYALGKTNDIQENKEKLIGYFRKTIEIKYEKTKKDFAIDETFLQKLQHRLREHFPLLGNNKFIQITSAKTQENIRKHFATKGIQHIEKEITEIMEEEFDTFDSLEDTVFFFTQWIDSIFEKEIKKIYERFAIKYITEELEVANKRKEKSKEQISAKNKEEQEPSWKSDMINMMHQEENTIKEEDLFLEELCKNIPNTQGAIKYIRRLHRNGKSIRIAELQERFIMPEKEVFTEDIITKAKNLGIYFEKNGKQENEKENTKEKKVIKKTNRNELGPIYEKSEKEQLQEEIDEYIDTKNTCTIDDCLHIIDMAGYEIGNQSGFIKECNELYKGAKGIDKFAHELCEKILKINEKPNMSNRKTYRSIELKDDRRVLFLEKNIIDGIYLHNDYMRRLINQK